MEKEMSQKDLAQKVNEKPSVIQDYEAGKAIPNPQVLGKLERALGVKLRGAYPRLSTTVLSLTMARRHWDWREAGGTKEVVGWPLPQTDLRRTLPSFIS